MKFYIISDLHYYDKSLGTKGEAFEAMCISEAKILRYSHEIYTKVLEEIAASEYDAVFFLGDFTANAEEISHQSFLDVTLSYLDKEKIFIIPGNHDFGTQDAFKYTENGEPTPVSSISQKQYEDRYYDYGAKQAISRDKNSLSYLLEFEEFYCLCLDSSSYLKQNGNAVISGELSQATLEWVGSLDKTILTNKKPIIAMIHHSVIPHFPLHEHFFPDFLVRNHKDVADTLEKAGIKVIITGHHHANSVASSRVNNTELLDIQCGSPVTYPLAYKEMNIKDSIIELDTKSIDFLVDNVSLKDLAYDLLSQNIDGTISHFQNELDQDLLNSEKIKKSLNKRFIAYYAGENLNKSTIEEHNTIIKEILKKSGHSTEVVDAICRFFIDKNSGLKGQYDLS